MRNKVYASVEHPSICPSSLLLWAGPAGRRYRSIAARRTTSGCANAGSGTLSACVVAEHRLVLHQHMVDVLYHDFGRFLFLNVLKRFYYF